MQIYTYADRIDPGEPTHLAFWIGKQSKWIEVAPPFPTQLEAEAFTLFRSVQVAHSQGAKRLVLRNSVIKFLNGWPCKAAVELAVDCGIVVQCVQVGIGQNHAASMITSRLTQTSRASVALQQQ